FPAFEAQSLAVATDREGRWLVISDSGFGAYSTDNAMSWVVFQALALVGMTELTYLEEGKWLAAGERRAAQSINGPFDWAQTATPVTTSNFRIASDRDGRAIITNGSNHLIRATV